MTETTQTGTAASGESSKATTAGTEVAGEHEGKAGFPPFDPQTFPSQLLWFAVAFGLLYLLMSRVALPRVAAILEKRSAKIAADLDAAQRMKADSDAAAVAYEKSLAEARAKAQAIAGETRDAVSVAAEAQRKTIEAELSAKLSAAEATIAVTKSTAMANVRSIAGEAATAIVEQLTGKVPSADVVSAAVDAAAS